MEVLEVGLKEMKDNPDLTYSYWYVTGLCNYECDYCDIFHDEQIQDWSLKQSIIDFFNYWGTQKKQKVLLYGGEPTLDPDFPKIIEGLNDYVRIFTNLSQGLAYWKELLQIRQDMTISISLHIHKCQPDVLMEKVKFLVEETDAKVRVKIMADSRYKEESIRLYKVFKNLYKTERYECYIDLVFPNSEGDIGAQWKDKDMDWFLDFQDFQTLYLKYKENGIVKERETSWNEMRATMLPSNHYYYCMAGSNTIFVDSNGDVYPCKSHKEVPMFNVQDDYKSCTAPEGMVCNYMGFCCETEIPKKLVCRRRVGEDSKNIRNILQ
jgi:MoaA/NifB/PqqE/SkfB family radical SAM enzyme